MSSPYSRIEFYNYKKIKVYKFLVKLRPTLETNIS